MRKTFLLIYLITPSLIFDVQKQKGGQPQTFYYRDVLMDMTNRCVGPFYSHSIKFKDLDRSQILFFKSAFLQSNLFVDTGLSLIFTLKSYSTAA